MNYGKIVTITNNVLLLLLLLLLVIFYTTIITNNYITTIMYRSEIHIGKSSFRTEILNHSMQNILH